MKKYLVHSAVVIFLFCVSCKESYEPPVIKTNPNLLVVDGFLNNSPDTTTIRLSRTRKLTDGTIHAEETNSQIILEESAGTALYFFQETPDGRYIVPGMNLDLNKTYRLHIRTIDGKEYYSDDIIVKPTPLIDSISWQKTNDGVMIYANTHDDQNKTLYYRWEFENTWQYHSSFYSSYKYENGIVVPRQTVLENIYDCWSSAKSTDLLLGSSAKLASDVIHLQPIRFIGLNTVQLSVKYSILVKQYALTKESYEYYENLRKITEQLGSIFDAQPSQLAGNIHSVSDPNELVLGYVTASSADSKRIFIDNTAVRPWNYNDYCVEKKIAKLDSLGYYFGNGAYIPIEKYFVGASLVGYYAGTEGCVDCRTKGGLNVKPDFWP